MLTSKASGVSKSFQSEEIESESDSRCLRISSASPETNTMNSRKKMPDLRMGGTKKVTVGKIDVYVTVTFFDDGSPGELFIKVAKEGSFTRGMFEIIAKQVSLLLQSGWTFEEVREKITVVKFDGSELFEAIFLGASEVILQYKGMSTC